MTTEEKIKEVLFLICGDEDIKDESLLQDELLLDSLGMVTLLIEIEDAFDITLDESDMNPFDLMTVNDVINLVKKYVGEDHA